MSFLNYFNTLEQKIEFYYKTKIVYYWPSNIVNAQLVIENCWRFGNIYEMLTTIVFDEDFCLHKQVENNSDIENFRAFSNWEISRFPFYSFEFSSQDYFNTLNISKFSYPEFVASALIYVIRHTFDKNYQICTRYNVIKVISPLFLTDNELSRHIFGILFDLEYVAFSPSQSIEVFVNYLYYEFIININVENDTSKNPCWSFYLQFFPYFSTGFIEDCIADCKSENSLLPVYLALHKYQIELEIGNRQKELKRYLNFIKQKIIKEKRLSNRFIEKSANHLYYPSLSWKSSPSEFLKDLKLSIPVVPILLFGFGTAGIITDQLSNKVAIQTPSQLTQQKFLPTLRENKAFKSTWFASNSNFRRRTFPPQSLSGDQLSVLPLMTPAPSDISSRIYDIQESSLQSTVFLEKNNQLIMVDVFTIDGKKYFSLYGLSGRYQNFKKIKPELDQVLQKVFPFPYYQDISVLLTGNDSRFLEEDHVLVKDLRASFYLKRKDANASTVPGSYNALRTNNRFKVKDFTCYDFRIDPRTSKNYTIRTLFEERNTQAFLNWLVTLRNNYPNDREIIDLISPGMDRGLYNALQNDLELIDLFLKPFSLTVDSPESILIFQKQLFLVAEDQLLSDFKTLKVKYEEGNSNSVTLNFAVKQLLAKEREMCRLGLEIDSLISNKKYKAFSKKKVCLHTEELKRVVNACINEFCSTAGFDEQLAKKDLKNFFTDLRVISASTDLLAKSTLGNLYPGSNHNNTYVDYTIPTAKNQAKQEKKDINFYVRPPRKTAQPESRTKPTPLSSYFGAKSNIERFQSLQDLDSFSQESAQDLGEKTSAEVAELQAEAELESKNIINTALATTKSKRQDELKQTGHNYWDKTSK